MTADDWKGVAVAKRLGIPESDIANIAQILETLDAAFRPFVTTIPQDVEPAIILSEAAVSGE